MDRISEVIMVTKEMIFKKCWLKDEEKSCKKFVLNTFIETYGVLTPSYTINLASAQSELFLNKQILGKMHIDDTRLIIV